MKDARITFQTEDMPWTCADTQGVSYKSLRFDPESRAGAVLIHMCPETTYPRHRLHAGAEILVLDGDLVVGGVTVHRGGYAHLPPETESAPRSEKGCVLFVTFAGRVENIH